MIDPKYIGMKLPPYTVEVEKARLRFFAKAIGETNPLYTDTGARIPVPPTYFFSLENDVPEPLL